MSTYQELQKKGTEILEAAGIEEASLDSRLLLEDALGIDHNTLIMHGDTSAAADAESRFLELIARRAQREPIAYILEQSSFMGLDFHVTSDVLIPEQDTEILVEEVLKEIFDGMEVLDLCTGSGCIALSLLHYTNDTKALATDLSSKALMVARDNARRLELADRISFEETDLWPTQQTKVDIIVSNPPYIRTDVIESLAPEVRDHEPRMALDGDADGLVFYRRIIERADKFLRSSGYLFLEIGYDQAQQVVSLLEAQGTFHDIEVIQDYSGNDRVIKACYY